MVAHEISTLTNNIAPIAAKYGVKRVKLFGSRARGDNKPQSDYDFLISKGEIHSLLQYAAFIAELEELLGLPVDVITDTSDDEFLINKAETEGIEIYADAKKKENEKNDLSLEKAVSDSLNMTNLYGPFNSAEEAVSSMLED